MNVKVYKGLFAYVLLCFFLLINDYIQYIAKIDYSASLVFSGIITLVVWKKFLSRHIHTYKIKINKFDIAAICIILFWGIMRICIPDSSNDTLNYHIYFQQFLGRDFVNYDFFPNRVMNEVSLYFADRMFYLFRYFLGFRMGTVLNVFVSVLFYIQLKDFVKSILSDMTLRFEVKDYAVALIALSGILIENFLLDFNIYYVDLLALPFILECVRIVIFDEENSGYKMCFVAFIAGISISLKMSNAFFLIPLALAYIIKFRKSITVKRFIISVLTALFTVAIYLYISFKLTGNPLFPYLNSVFKSPYFATDISPNTLSDFYRYFGAKNLLQFIFWPIYILINPEVCANAGYYIGYIIQCFIVLFIAFFSKKKYGKKIFYVDVIWIIFYFMYLIAINGFNRYAIIVDSLSAVIIGIYCYVWIKESRNIILKCVSYITVFSVVIVIGIAIRNVDIRNISRAGSKSFITDFNGHIENAKYLFKDYESGLDKKLVNDVDYWYITEYNSGFAGLIKPQIPMIISSYGVTNDVSEEIFNKQLENMKDKNIYTISKDKDILRLIKKIKDDSFRIKDVYVSKCNYYDATKSLVFVKLEYDKNINKNISIYNLKDSNEYCINLADYNYTGYSSEFFIGPENAASGIGKNGFSVKAELVSDNGSKELFDTKWEPGSPYEKEDICIPKDEISENAEIKFTVYNADEKNYNEGGVNIIEQSKD